MIKVEHKGGKLGERGREGGREGEKGRKKTVVANIQGWICTLPQKERITSFDSLFTLKINLNIHHAP